MKFFRLSILLMCCFLMNAFQAKAQCSISNLTVTSINCVPNGANQDITYCGTFMASNTNGSYDVTAFHQAFLDVTTSINNLATDGLVSFCATVPNVSFDPEGIVINEVFNNACSATFAGGLPSPCNARGACALTNLNVSNITCDGSGGMRVVGSFTAANGSGNYRIQINGIPPNFAQTHPLPSSPMNGVVNFDVVIPNYDFSNTGSGVTIEDNLFTCTSNAATGVAIPANAAACPAAAAPAAQAPIPTMSQWGLMIFGLLVLNLGVFFLYRKQSQFIK